MHPSELQPPLMELYCALAGRGIRGGKPCGGYRQFRKESGDRTLWRALRESMDPPIFSVMLEGSAAIIGIAMAFLGLWLAQEFQNPVFDGAASLGIGCLLTAVIDHPGSGKQRPASAGSNGAPRQGGNPPDRWAVQRRKRGALASDSVLRTRFHSTGDRSRVRVKPDGRRAGACGRWDRSCHQAKFFTQSTDIRPG